MLRKAGKLTAILMAGLMIASPLTEVVTFADELESIRDEAILTQDLSGDSSEEILMENASDDEEDEAVVLDADEDTPEAEDADASFGTGSDDLDADYDVPVTKGKVLRLAKAGTGIQKGQHIYFGKVPTNTSYGDSEHSNLPYWRVLNPSRANDNYYDPENGQDGYMFVMSESLWGDNSTSGSISFSKTGASTYVYNWQGSNAQKFCKDLYTNGFEVYEQNAMYSFDKTDYAYGNFGTSELKKSNSNNDIVFMLSVKELCDYVSSKDLASSNNLRSAKYKGDTRTYWLRSVKDLGTTMPHYQAGLVYDGGDVNNMSIYEGANSYYIRPAFNLKLDNILFTSAADNGKPGDGKLASVKDGNVSDWKLTLKDTSRDSFEADIVGGSKSTVKANEKIKVHFKNSKTGENEYVSAVICDKKESNVLYYGRIFNCKDVDNGNAELTVPDDIPAGEYKLKIFSEQYNGDKKTDYASMPETFPLAVERSEQTIKASNFTKNIGDAAFKIGATTSGDGKLTYQSSNPSVAKVDANGTVTIVGAGTAKITITAAETDKYKAAKKEITITVGAAGKTDITKATVTGIKNKTYNGKARTATPTVKLDGKKLVANTDYEIKYLGDRKSAGTQKFQIIGKNNYTGTINKSFKISRAKNTLKVSLKKKKVSVKESDVASKNKTIKANKVIKVSKAIGKVTYKKKSGDSKIKVSSSGKITVKKGLKKGTYKVKVQVKAKGNTNYHSKKKDVSFKIVVK